MKCLGSFGFSSYKEKPAGLGLNNFFVCLILLQARERIAPLLLGWYGNTQAAKPGRFGSTKGLIIHLPSDSLTT
jgi:hypothetical protein